MKQISLPANGGGSAELDDAGWEPVDRKPRVVAERIATATIQQWQQQGIAPARARLLADDVEMVVRAMMVPDFDEYNKLMTSKGARLDNMAENWIPGMFESAIYPSTTPELDPTNAIVDQVRYVWNTPAPRYFKWMAVNTDAVLVGKGLISTSNTGEWPFNGYYAQISLYAPASGRLSYATGLRLDKSEDESAWIRLDVAFESGLKTKVRINFYFDQDANAWFPSSILVGNNWPVRPIPLL